MVKRGRLHPAMWVIIAAVGAVVLVALVALGTRYGLVSSPGRALIESRLDGLKLGRIGTLRIRGLSGDIFTDFTVRQLTISDEKGVWLEARQVHVEWDYLQLFRRRFEAEAVSARELRLLRRPTLTPKGQSRDLPVSFEIDSLKARVEMLPAFSQRRGLFDLTGRLLVERKGVKSGRFEARSLLHKGDFLNADFEFGRDEAIRLHADAREAAGGALAGALGLSPDLPFTLDAQATGTTADGRFRVIARTGDATPVNAFGLWNEDGGAAAGKIMLRESQLTQRYVERFGPVAEFSVGGSRFRGGNYMVDGRVEAENLTVAFKGPADLMARRLTPAGLTATIDTNSVKRIFGGVVDAKARAVGNVRGRWSDWTFTGTLEGRDLTAPGYRLARATGPAKLVRRNGEFTLTGELNGAGGSGRGYLAAALGQRPHVTFVGSRLKSGEMLIRKVVATGPGLVLDATGSRSIFGNFSFKGDATLSNLAAAHAGAKGVVKMDWSASRRGGRGNPWQYDFDARGSDFAAGFSEFDRLMGTSPRLRATGSYSGGVITVARSTLDGAAGSVRASGVKGRGGSLDFKGDWNAKGPFRAGPLEISGDAKGSGTVTGTLSAPRANLVADFDAIDLPRLPLKNAHVELSFRRAADATNGDFAMRAASEYGPARIETAFRFMPGGVDLTRLDADAGGIKAQGAVSLRRNRPSSADLTLAIGPGVLLERGRISGTMKIADRAGGAFADIDLTAKDAVLVGAGDVVISSGTLRGSGPMARLPVSVNAEGNARPGRWRIEGDGVLSTQEEGYTLAMNASGRLGRADIRTVETAVLRFGGPERSAKLRLAVGAGRADIDARLNEAGANVAAVLNDVALGAFNEDLTGRVDARASLQGQGERLTGSLDATLRGARSRGVPQSLSLDGTVQARLNDNSLAIDASATNAQGLRSNANVVLPVEASAAPFRLAINTRRPMRGRFFADGEIKPLWDLFVGGERSLAGRVVTEGTLGGSLADPRITGVASLAGGSFDDGQTGLRLRNIALAAVLEGEQINVSSLTATDGDGGRLTGQGRISLERSGASSFRLDLARFQLIDNDMATAEATGAATISRDAQGRVKLTGALTIDRADIAADPPTPSGVVTMDVIEINRPTSLDRGLQIEPARGPAVALDVDLKAPRRIFVEGRGLDVELSLDAHVGGTTRDPQLTGVARVVRGEYNFAGKRFEFDQNGAVYLGSSAEDIRLDLTATRDDPSLTAVIRVRGTAARPEITLTSTPMLPSDEVLSQVLFGASASQLSPVEAAQLASALAALAGGGGFDVIGGLRGLTGLDRLTFGGGGEAGGLTVAGGKYLTDDVYLEIIGGGREGPAVQVEWRVRRNLAIVSRLAGQGDARLSVRWRRDY
ncbi:MAG TPA: translocation/assembly module TamB domain-containing protein [Caulobacteraceae bacterium]|nr:translocation/assembly module TamB domain-containing protein [Caulobacteraceae bacterium]